MLFRSEEFVPIIGEVRSRQPGEDDPLELEVPCLRHLLEARLRGGRSGGLVVIGGVIALLFWIYLSANILLFGAEVASETGFALRGAERKGQPRSTGGLDTDWRRSLVALVRGLVMAPPDDKRPLDRRRR